MQSFRQVNATITEGNSLKFLSQSYSEVAAAKLKRIRRGIERNRSFLSEIATIYAMLKLVATQRQYEKVPSASPFLDTATRLILKGGQLLPFRRGAQLGVLPQKLAKTTINILLTSNYRFYGSLERNLIEFFLNHARRFANRSLVVGRIGIEFLNAIKFTPFEPMIFTADMPNIAELKTLTENIVSYDRVLVFHSSFQSVLSQTSHIKDIKEAQFEVSIPRKKIDYIFEPEIDKMIAFFDTQISSILLEQTFLESELARTAARLVTMNNAEENANKFLGQQKRFLAQAARSLYNIALLDSLSGRFHQRRKRYGQ